MYTCTRVMPNDFSCINLQMSLTSAFLREITLVILQAIGYLDYQKDDSKKKQADLSYPCPLQASL